MRGGDGEPKDKKDLGDPSPTRQVLILLQLQFKQIVKRNKLKTQSMKWAHCFSRAYMVIFLKSSCISEQGF